MSRSIIIILLVALFCHASLQIGILYVDHIWGNQDTHYVNVEDVVIDDTTMIVDFISRLTDVGVFVEQTQFIMSDVNVPGFIHVHKNATLHGPLHANGGIYADDADDEFDFNTFENSTWSFVVEDNTGNTHVAGQLRPFGGINVNNDLFYVRNITGETRVCCALLRPNGGIELKNGLFDVSADDGGFRTTTDGIVNLDFIFGNSLPQNKLVTRVPSATEFGGNFIIKGQDSTSIGGNLVIIPGEAETNGDIYFGRQFADNLYIGRSGADAFASNGGETVIGGQDAFDGDGGSLIFIAGGSTNANFNGGDILLDVGISTENGLPGRILLGTDKTGISNFELLVRRPIAAQLSGQTTLFYGQDSTTGAGTSGGDYYLQAGDVTNGVGLPGSLSIVPGEAQGIQGNILLGQGGSDLHITRLPVYHPAGDTYLIGQDTKGNGQPGDLYLSAGQTLGVGNAVRGGDIWVMPGTTPEGTPGKIIWGNYARDLVVGRFNLNNLGPSTTILAGQTSNVASGGDFNLYGGEGNLQGGRLSLQAGTNNGNIVGGNGGNVAITAGNGNQNGGSIFVNGGFGNSGSGGSININAGSSSQIGTIGGSITLSAGPGTVPGNIVVGPAAASFFVDDAQVYVVPQFITLQSGANSLVISAVSPTSILSFNGRTLLRTIVTGITPIDNTAISTFDIAYEIVNNLSSVVQSIVCAVGPSGHGLVNVVSILDGNVSCPLP